MLETFCILNWVLATDVFILIRNHKALHFRSGYLTRSKHQLESKKCKIFFSTKQPSDPGGFL